jgi:hypothetical protein
MLARESVQCGHEVYENMCLDEGQSEEELFLFLTFVIERLHHELEQIKRNSNNDGEKKQYKMTKRSEQIFRYRLFLASQRSDVTGRAL